MAIDPVHDLLRYEPATPSPHPPRAAGAWEERGTAHEERQMTAVQEPRPTYSILVADDDQPSREALRDILTPEGFQTMVASSGEEAVDIVMAQTIHLIVLDMHMPTLTGVETLRLVRQFNARLPAILVTGDANESVVRAAIQAQFFSVLPKPVSKHLLLYTLVKALSRVYGKA
jgi:CheY-like chemotaxis protein